MSRRAKRLRKILSCLGRESRRAREAKQHARRFEHMVWTRATVQREYVTKYFKDILRKAMKKPIMFGQTNTPQMQELLVTMTSQMLLETSNSKGDR